MRLELTDIFLWYFWRWYVIREFKFGIQNEHQSLWKRIPSWKSFNLDKNAFIHDSGSNVLLNTWSFNAICIKHGHLGCKKCINTKLLRGNYLPNFNSFIDDLKLHFCNIFVIAILPVKKKHLVAKSRAVLGSNGMLYWAVLGCTGL